MANTKTKLSMLPDKTRIQTLKPYLDNDKYRTTILVITSTYGCQRGIIDTPKRDDDVNKLWDKIHDMLIRVVCERKKCDISFVKHLEIESVKPTFSLRGLRSSNDETMTE